MGFFKKKAEGARAAADKMQKKDLFEATVAGAVLVAFADGELEEKEAESLVGIMQACDAFKNFQGEVQKTFERYVDLMRKGKTLGKMQLRKEIGEVKASEEERTIVFAAMCDVAGADGEVEPAEQAVLKDIGALLGVRVADFLS